MAQPPSPAWVGEQFISKYYDVLAKLPKHLHRFYKEDSTFSVADVQADGQVIVAATSGNLEDIQEKVMSTIANAVVASDKSLDAQFSQGNGVLLQVSGTMNLQGMDRKFVQVFFLATQEKGYYVLNDMLHIFPPEPARDTRPVENGFVAQPSITEPAFGLAPPQLPISLQPQVELASSMVPVIAVLPPAVDVQPPTPESDTVAAEKLPASVVAGQISAPPSAPAPAPVIALVEPAPTVPPEPLPALSPAPQPAPEPLPVLKQAVPAGPSVSFVPVPPLSNLSWAGRLVSSAASVSKPVTPAKAPPLATPVPASEAPAVEALSVTVIAPPVVIHEAEVPAEPQSNADGDDSAPEALEPVQAVAGNDQGFGVYVQGIPQSGDLKKLLSDQFAQFGAFGPGGVNVIRSPRFGQVAYIFYLDEQSRNAAREANGKLRLPDSDRPVKILGMLPEFERGFAPRGERGRGAGTGSGYRGGRGSFDGSRGRGGRGEGGRGDRPLGGRGGRDRSGRGGGAGRGPRESSSGPAGPKVPI